jgi:hypothetical protein
MSDRELLENAAKAAGNPIGTSRAGGGLLMANDLYWNPLTDDGDALRLAVTCGLVVDCSRPSAGEPYKQHAIWRDETMSNAELTRRAIVRAAAQIGRIMT